VANDTATRLLARVKELRQTRGLSQEAFAEKAGLGYKYYQHVESGRRRDIRLSTLEKLAKACGLKLWELLKFDVSSESVPVEKANDGLPGSPGRVTRKTPTPRVRSKAT
jgi:transcriptional regulator with XRE-family HTH domain